MVWGSLFSRTNRRSHPEVDKSTYADMFRVRQQHRCGLQKYMHGARVRTNQKRLDTSSEAGLVDQVSDRTRMFGRSRPHSQRSKTFFMANEIAEVLGSAKCAALSTGTTGEKYCSLYCAKQWKEIFFRYRSLKRSGFLLCIRQSTARYKRSLPIFQ